MDARTHTSLRGTIAGAAGLALAAGAAAAWPLFGNPQFRTLSDAPALACADLDADGVPDLAVANLSDVSLSVMITEEACALVDHSSIDLAPASSVQCVVVADLDGDAIPDLIASLGDEQKLALAYGNGDGTFQTPVLDDVHMGACRLHALDVDLDADTDLVVASLDTETVRLMINRDSGFDVGNGSNVGSVPAGLDVGDLNVTDDQDPDVAVAVPGLDKVVVLINQNGTQFEDPPTDVALEAGASPRAVAIADLDGVHGADLAVASHGLSRVHLVMNNQAHDFSAATVIPIDLGDAPSWIAAGDLDGDGAPDLVTANEDASTVSVLINDGAGSFAITQEPSVTAGPAYVEIADLNDDGAPEIVLSHNAGEVASILVNDGAGWFSSYRGEATVPDPFAMTLVDMGEDGAGDLDVVVVSDVRQGGATTNEIWIHHGDGAGGFEGTYIYPEDGDSAQPMVAVAAADLDGDGDADLATIELNDVTRDIQIYTNDGDGTLTVGTEFSVEDDASFIRAFDVDEDGVSDLIVGSYDAFSVHLNDGSAAFTYRGYDARPGLRDIEFVQLDDNGSWDLQCAVDGPGGGNGSIVYFNDGAGGFETSGSFSSIDIGDPPSPLHADLSGVWGSWKTVLVSAVNQRFYHLIRSSSSGEWTLLQAIPTGPDPVAMSGDWLAPSFGDDFAVADRVDGAAWVFRFDLEEGDFSRPTAYGVGTEPAAIALGDMSSDGRLDAVTLVAGTGEVSVNLRIAPPALACLGDVDGDGDTDVFDFASMAAHFGVGPGATQEQGDLDGDGYVNVFDFATLAGDFGCGP
jgi:hypothetical protein